MVLEEIDDAARHLKGWMEAQNELAGITTFSVPGPRFYEPCTALIISGGVSSFMLALSPLVGAVAAGNAPCSSPPPRRLRRAKSLGRS